MDAFCKSRTMSHGGHTWKKLTTGLIDIDLRFRMEPMLAKRIYMDADGLFRGSFNILSRVIGRMTTNKTLPAVRMIVMN